VTLKIYPSLALALLLTACGSNSTTGRTVRLRSEIVADAEIEREFETRAGWTVRVSSAALSLGSLYYFDGEPAFVQRRERSLWRHLAELVGPSVAYAHPGHYLEGEAKGQMTQAAVVALSAEPTPLPDGNGITGLYRSGRFVFAESARSDAELAGAIARVEGSASKDGKTVYFMLSASLADAERNARGGEVNGCVFEEAEVEGDGLVTVSVKPSVWLSLVEFDELDSGTPETPTKVAAGESAQIAFSVGVVQLSAYRFVYSAD
jgi:hypothetical protein